jgi:hypothetical protein
MSEATIRRHVTADPFARVKRAMLEAQNLSWKAKGILSYLLGKPDNWQLKEADLINRGNDGRDSVRSGIAELQSAGYLRKEVVKGKSGQFSRNIWHITDTPGYADEIQPSPCRISRCGFSDAENPTLSKKEASKNEEEEKKGVVQSCKSGTEKLPAPPATENLNNLEASPSAKPTPPSPPPQRPPLPPASPWTIAFGIELPESLRTQPCLDAVNLWLQHKKEKGDAYKPTGLRTTFKKWEKEFTPDQLPDAIENAITLNWRGVYKPNQGGFGKASPSQQQPWQLRKALESKLEPLKDAYLRHPANPNSRRYDPDASQEVVDDAKAKRAEIKSIEQQLAQIPVQQ